MAGVAVIALAVVATSVSILLAGCSGGVGFEPSPSQPSSTAPGIAPSRSSSSSAEVNPPKPAPPVTPGLVPGGGATDNLPYFTWVASRFLGQNLSPGGKPIINALVAAGFSRPAMQVTPDKTTFGNDTDSVQFSVRFPDGCLVGQTSAAGFHSIVGPMVAGNCLVGVTRTIDW